MSDMFYFMHRKCGKGLLTLLVVIVCVAIIAYLFLKDVSERDRLARFSQAAVSTDAKECAPIGR